ncbi:MAG: prolyl oligopeptidase family serine peptidase [Candidatus Dormibacteraceae bacterium]
MLAQVPHLTPEDVARFRAVSDPQISPDRSRVAFVLSTVDEERDRDVDHLWEVPLTGSGEPRQLTDGEDGERSPRWSPGGRWLGFLAKRGGDEAAQVWLLPAAGGEARRATALPGGVTGFTWSPSGERLAVVAVVRPASETAAEKARPVVTRRLGYKHDGQGVIGERRAHLFRVDLGDSGGATQLTSGECGVADPAWSASGEEIAFVAATHEDRDLDGASDVFAIPASGGEPRRLTTWHGAAAAPLWTADGGVLLVGAEDPHDPMSTLLSVPAGGGSPAPLLAGFDRTVMLGAPAYPGGRPALGADGSIVFCARVGGTVHVFRRDLEGALTALVDGQDQVVSGLSVAEEAIVVAVGDRRQPGDLFLVTEAGERRLTEVNRDLLQSVQVSIPERRTFTAPDGTEIEAYLDRPANQIAPAPLLLEIHGGPHNSIGPVLWPAHLHGQELVGRGWVVVAPNPRGSDGYGHDFIDGVTGGWGERDEQDFFAVLDALVAEGIADPDRLCVTGYSYGGFMTSWLVGHSRRFHRAAAGGVIVDLLASYGTTDMGAALAPLATGREPFEDWARYDALSPIRFAGAIETPLLIQHGEQDDRCDMGQAEELFNVLRTRRREVELVRYPGSSHSFPVAGRPSHRAEYQRRIVEWVTR